MQQTIKIIKRTGDVKRVKQIAAPLNTDKLKAARKNLGKGCYRCESPDTTMLSEGQHWCIPCVSEIATAVSEYDARN